MPLRIGLVCGAAGLVLALVGIVRGSVPLNPLSIFLALFISGGSWFLVSWAVATAAFDVEQEVGDPEVGNPEFAGDEATQGAVDE